jgi:hypothetical protein
MCSTAFAVTTTATTARRGGRGMAAASSASGSTPSTAVATFTTGGNQHGCRCQTDDRCKPYPTRPIALRLFHG